MRPSPQETKEMLLKVHGIIPPEMREQLRDAVRREFGSMRFSGTMKGTAIGAACGAALELLQFDKLTGIEDWTEIGAACGAAVGLALDYRARQAKPDLQGRILHAQEGAPGDVRA